MDKNLQDSKDFPILLWRYVKPSWLDTNGSLLSYCFDLRSDPPEEYVSFYEGKGSTEEQRLSFVIEIFAKRRFSLKETGRFLSIDPRGACDLVNYPVPIIEFRDEQKPHYGMHYLVEDEPSRLEAKNILSQIANLHDLKVPLRVKQYALQDNYC